MSTGVEEAELTVTPLGTQCFHSSIYYQDEITEGGHLVVEMQYSDDIQIYTMTSGPSWKQTWVQS